MVWLVLAFWWVLFPAVPEFSFARWSVHLWVVCVLGLCSVPTLWRSKLALGWPFVATVLACLSLAVAMHTEPDRFPGLARWWAGLTGWAHGLFFLLALLWVPARRIAGHGGRQGERAETADVEELETPAERQLRHVMFVLLLSMVVAQVVIVLARDVELLRPEGGLGNPNILGAFAAATGLALAAFVRWRPWGLATLAALLVLMVSTSSRGAAAAMMVVALVFLARRRVAAALGAAVSMVLALVLIPNPLWERVVQLSGAARYSRPFIWQAGLSNLLEHPLGIGPSMNRYVFPPLADGPGVGYLIHQRHAVGLTHNIFLTLGLEWGWLALAAAVGLALWALVALLRRRSSDPLGQGAALGALVLFLELQIDGVEQNPVVFSVFLLLAAMVLRRVTGRGRGPLVSGRWAAVAVVLACGLFGSQALRRTRGVAALKSASSAVDAFRAGEGTEALARGALAVAHAREPREPGVALARFHMERKLLELAVAEEQPLDLVGRHGAAAVEAILLARSLNPADPELVRWHANLELWLHFNANGGGQALDAYFETMDDLLRLDPLDVGAMRRMAVQLGAVGRQAEMDALLDRILELEPDDAMAWIMRGRYSALDGHTESALHAFVRAKEAIFNCRVKAHSNSPRTRRFYEKILRDVDLSMVRRSIRNLRLSLEI